MLLLKIQAVNTIIRKKDFQFINAMRYRTALLILISCLVAISCEPSPERKGFEAESLLSQTEMESFKYSVIRYMAHLAPNADHESKFSPRFDDFYRKKSGEHHLEYLYFDKEKGAYFFLATRIAPSLYDKRVAIGGVLYYDDNGEISYYEEKFRTWKMEESELMWRSEILFREMISGNDLAEYHRENTGDDEYIEFPNPHTYFDTDERQWMSTLFDPRESLPAGK